MRFTSLGCIIWQHGIEVLVQCMLKDHTVAHVVYQIGQPQKYLLLLHIAGKARRDH